MQPATQAAWREAAHVGLAAAAGKREPGPGSGGAAAVGIHLHSPLQLPAWGSQHSPGRGGTSPIPGTSGSPLGLEGELHFSSLLREGRDPPKPFRQRYRAPRDAGVPMLSG